MKKNKKQVEFTKLLDLEKEDVAGLSIDEQKRINGGNEEVFTNYEKCSVGEVCRPSTRQNCYNVQ